MPVYTSSRERCCGSVGGAPNSNSLSASARGTWLLRAVVPWVIFVALACAVTINSVSTNYYFGTSLGYDQFGKESMGRWYAIIDICTGALPLGAGWLWRNGRQRTAKWFGLPIVLYTAFCALSLTGFAATQRFAVQAQADAMTKGYSEAKSTKLALIEKQTGWNNTSGIASTTDRFRQLAGLSSQREVRAELRASRAEAREANERLIDKAGQFDPKSIVVPVGDAQSDALAAYTPFTAQAWATFLSLFAAVLVVLAKPIFLCLAVVSFPKWELDSGGAQERSQAGNSQRKSPPQAMPECSRDQRPDYCTPNAPHNRHVIGKRLMIYPRLA
jgi:hypothetical protein